MNSYVNLYNRGTQILMIYREYDYFLFAIAQSWDIELQGVLPCFCQTLECPTFPRSFLFLELQFCPVNVFSQSGIWTNVISGSLQLLGCKQHECTSFIHRLFKTA